MLYTCGLYLFLLSLTVSVFGHENSIKPEGLSWQTWHMVTEHEMDEFDADSFFTLHDLNGKGTWDRNDILNLYGLLRDQIVGDGDGMGEHSHEQEAVSVSDKDRVYNTVLNLCDSNGDGVVSIEEWRTYMNSGHELPDFGYGQGHHLDFEREYEEHHWNKYHAKDDPDVLIKHPEDIEHELLHHEHEIEESHKDHPEVREVAKNYDSHIKIENIPLKYRS